MGGFPVPVQNAPHSNSTGTVELKAAPAYSAADEYRARAAEEYRARCERVTAAARLQCEIQKEERRRKADARRAWIGKRLCYDVECAKTGKRAECEYRGSLRGKYG